MKREFDLICFNYVIVLFVRHMADRLGTGYLQKTLNQVRTATHWDTHTVKFFVDNITNYSYYTCIIHVLYMYYTCIIHVLYMYNTCTIHVLYMYCTLLFDYFSSIPPTHFAIATGMCPSKLLLLLVLLLVY